jgi:hypothetical protein
LLLTLVGLGVFIFISEKGRAIHGNFVWQVYACSSMVYLACARLLLDTGGAATRGTSGFRAWWGGQRLVDRIAWAMLAAQSAMGLAYLTRFIVRGAYG